MPERFSDRKGYRGEAKEIIIREEAPGDFRSALLLIAKGAGMTPGPIREVICEVLLTRPDPNNWSDYPNIWNEANELIDSCDWFRVYDVAEGLYEYLNRNFPDKAEKFEERLNQYFSEHGIGWQLTGGEITYRGSEAFSEATSRAADSLAETGHNAAAREVAEALKDISRRPHPDVTGSIQHVIAALECTARDVTGEPTPTLGKLIKPLGLPPPLDSAVEKLWGFASDRARHVREGHEVSTEEAELIVSVACALCSFLASRKD